MAQKSSNYHYPAQPSTNDNRSIKAALDDGIDVPGTGLVAHQQPFATEVGGIAGWVSPAVDPSASTTRAVEA